MAPTSVCRDWLDPLLLAYRDHRGAESWPLVPYRCELDGSTIRLALENGGVATGRASAWKLLAGRYWAQTFPPGDRELYAAWIPTLRDWNNCTGFDLMLRDERVLHALLEASRFFTRSGQDWEAILCFLQVDWYTSVGAEHLSPRARERFERRRAFDIAHDEEMKRHGGMSVNQLVELVDPWFRHDDPLERIEAAHHFAMVQQIASYNRWLRLEPRLRFVFAVSRDPEPLISELGFGLVEYVAWILSNDFAYAEALPYLDHLIESHVGLSLYLAQRWECHCALGNDVEATADWERLSRLCLPWKLPAEYDVYRQCEDSDPALLRVAGLTRAAIANVRWARREDPCVARRITKAFMKKLKPPGIHISLARKQIAEAESLLPDLLEALPKRSSDCHESRRFFALANVFLRIGEVREIDGDLSRAQAAYTVARETLCRTGYQHLLSIEEAIERVRCQVGSNIRTNRTNRRTT